MAWYNITNSWQPVTGIPFATLDATGKLDLTQLPNLAISSTTVVADQAARLALTAEIGDIAIQTDTGLTYILAASPASTNSNWKTIAATNLNGSGTTNEIPYWVNSTTLGSSGIKNVSGHLSWNDDVGLKRQAAGKLQVTDGSTGYGSIYANVLGLETGNAGLSANGVLIGSNSKIDFSSTSAWTGTPDLTLKRGSANTLYVTDGSSAYGGGKISISLANGTSDVTLGALASGRRGLYYGDASNSGFQIYNVNTPFICVNALYSNYTDNTLLISNDDLSKYVRFGVDAADVLALRNSTNAQTLRVYGTYTDVNNYVRAALGATTTAVELKAETAGTGADDVDVNLLAAGIGTVRINKYGLDFGYGLYSGQRIFSGTYNGEIAIGAGIGNPGGTQFYFNSNSRLLEVQSGGGFGWSSAASLNGDSTIDTGLARLSAGVVKVTNGSTGYGRLHTNGLYTAGYFDCGYNSSIGLVLDSAKILGFSTDLGAGTADVAIARSSAGVVKVTDGSTGYGSIKASAFTLSDLNTAPTSSSATGTKGEIRVTADSLYVCIATDTWVKASLATW